MWDKEARLNFDGIAEQYKWTFSRSPVFDHDLFVVNYLGHPYQGGYYYNTLRSQGASAWHSALFCLAQSVLWEYVWEGSVEMPSIQDMIVTPVLGSLFGELAHVATVKMSRNGFTWYERIIVCFINPPYVMNNGFRFSLSSKIPDLKH
jgi:hypothetical protein